MEWKKKLDPFIFRLSKDPMYHDERNKFLSMVLSMVLLWKIVKGDLAVVFSTSPPLRSFKRPFFYYSHKK